MLVISRRAFGVTIQKEIVVPGELNVRENGFLPDSFL